MTSLLRRYSHYWPLLLLIALGFYNAHGNAFMQDDAYISYRYAKWFSRGYGLVWYPGSTEFGFTNFLYTLLIGIGMVLRIPPEIASNVINMVSFAVALMLSFYIAFALIKRTIPALAVVLLLATHHTFTGYATGGLETMFFTALILAFYALIIRSTAPSPLEVEGWSGGTNLLSYAGILAALALLTRLDAALLLFPGYVFLLFYNARSPSLPRKRESSKSSIYHFLLTRLRDVGLLAAILIPTLITLVFLLCCYIAYGYPLPNTFYIKVPGDGGALEGGLNYLNVYLRWQAYMPLLVPFFLLFYHLRIRHLKQFSGVFYTLLGVVSVWLGYIVYVGGDFMEFRFLVPILPLFYTLIFAAFFTLISKHQTRYFWLVLVLLAFGNFSHGLPRYYWDPRAGGDNFLTDRVATLYILEILFTERPNNAVIAGQKLHQLFYTGKASDVKIAVLPAGLIPYFSELPVIDVVGLNSRSIIHNHEKFLKTTGHKIRMTSEHIREIGVNLAIDHPAYFNGVQHCDVFPTFWMNRNIPGAPTVYIPLNGGQYLFTYYLNPHPRIEQLIAEKKIFRCIE